MEVPKPQYLYDLENDDQYHTWVWTDRPESELTSKMRAILIDWLCEVNSSFGNSIDNVVLATYILDAYCSVVSVSKDNFQKIGCMSMYIANSVIVGGSDLGSYVHMVDGTYTRTEFIEAYNDIIEKIGGRIIRPFPTLFLGGVFDDKSSDGLSDDDLSSNTPSDLSLEQHLSYISLFCSSHTSHKPSLVAATIKYLLGNESIFSAKVLPPLHDDLIKPSYDNLIKPTRDDLLLSNQIVSAFAHPEMVTICKEMTSVIKRGLKSSLPKFSKAVNAVHTHLQKSCPGKLNAIQKLPKDESHHDVKLPIFNTPYKKLGTLGSGIAGEVFKVQKGKGVFAVKYQKSSFIEELAILQLLGSCHHVVKLQGFLPSHKDPLLPPNKGAFLFFDAGDYALESAVKKLKFPSLNEATILRYFKDMLRGIQECHDRDVIHRDIKPDNIVWFENEKRFKIIDFGLAKAMVSHRNDLQETVVTLLYRAPEVFLTDGKYDTKIDIWAIGCVLYYMVTGMPFIGALGSESDILNYICLTLGTPTESTWPGVTLLKNWKRHNLPQYTPHNKVFSRVPNDKNMCYSIIRECLTMNPHERPTAGNLLQCIP